MNIFGVAYKNYMLSGVEYLCSIFEISQHCKKEGRKEGRKEGKKEGEGRERGTKERGEDGRKREEGR
jgi:hypothetical protein